MIPDCFDIGGGSALCESGGGRSGPAHFVSLWSSLVGSGDGIESSISSSDEDSLGPWSESEISRSKYSVAR